MAEYEEKILAASEHDKLKIVKEYLVKNYLEKDAMRISQNAITEYWGTIGDKYIDKLCIYMDITSTVPQMKAYITTLDICPYNASEKYFYIPFFC